MTTAREQILQAVRDASDGREHTVENADDVVRESKMLLDGIDGCRPALPSINVEDSFMARVSGAKVGASIDRIASLSHLPAAVARYLAANAMPAAVTLQPTSLLLGLDWAAAGVSPVRDLDDGVVVGMARWGIAETGSIVVHSASDMPILHNFLCATHIVAVPVQSILRHLEDYAEAARIAGEPAPRNVCLITGASGTTDIEGSLVKGAHGPRELCVILVDSVVQV